MTTQNPVHPQRSATPTPAASPKPDDATWPATPPSPARRPGRGDGDATPRSTERLLGFNLPRPVARGMAVVVALVVYLTVASVVKPGRSNAEPGVQRITPSKSLPALRAGKDADQWVRGIGPAAPEKNARGWRLIGQLVGSEKLIWIYGSPEGPRYTVCTKTGEILREDLEADDVYRVFPELDVAGMRLEPREGEKAGPLMTADIDRNG